MKSVSKTKSLHREGHAALDATARYTSGISGSFFSPTVARWRWRPPHAPASPPYEYELRNEAAVSSSASAAGD